MTAFVEVAVPFVVLGLPGTDNEAMLLMNRWSQ